MKYEVLLKFVCENCGKEFATWSEVDAYIDPETNEEIRCPRCGSTDISEEDVLEIG